MVLGDWMSAITLILEDGEDVVKSIAKFARQEKINYGMIISGKGAIREFEVISHGSRGAMEKFSNPREFEVNAISGKIEKRDGAMEVKVKVLMSSSGFTPLSGELLKGKTAGRLEIGITKIDMKKMITA